MNVLDGIRVVDFTKWIAGPTATLPLALMGAEVIKIENRKYPDIFRDDKGAISGGQTPSMHSGLNVFNSNKLSIEVDLHQPEGIEIVKKLVKVSDIVVENFRPGIMDGFGLGYDSLKQVKNDVIMLAVSSHGATGPERGYGGYAATFGPLSGLSYLTGYPDGEPSPIRSRADMMAGFSAAFAVLAALIHKQQSGQGQFIDFSAREALTCAIGESVMDYTMNGRIPSRQGNQDEKMAPHNCYRCKGQNKWVSIAVSTQEQWLALCQAMGNPTWTLDEDFADTHSRLQNQAPLDLLIEQWTLHHTHYEITEMLQEAGVAAFPSLNNQELVEDPHCQKRQIFTEIDYPGVGTMSLMGAACKLSDTPEISVSRAPLLGEHNQYVFSQILEMPQEEIARLQQQGIIG